MHTEPLLVVDGELRRPDRPGLGVELDPDALEKYGTPL
jgi:L-alanine-DL-glutamate epimerase-like enolase superfamily enzyme